MSLEQRYYEFLTRTDHPVFFKDYSQTSDINSPLNSIHNRIMAKQMVRVKALIDKMRLNTFPNTVDELTIDDWELQYFGFTKPSVPLDQRVDELLIKFNKRFKMNVGDVIDIARSIVGETPVVTRNLSRSGWVVGAGVLGISTTLGTVSGGQGVYLVIFTVPVDSVLLNKLDERLTIIEKAGSSHRIRAVIPRWVIGTATLGINTTLGA